MNEKLSFELYKICHHKMGKCFKSEGMIHKQNTEYMYSEFANRLIAGSILFLSFFFYQQCTCFRRLFLAAGRSCLSPDLFLCAKIVDTKSAFSRLSNLGAFFISSWVLNSKALSSKWAPQSLLFGLFNGNLWKLISGVRDVWFRHSEYEHCGIVYIAAEGKATKQTTEGGQFPCHFRFLLGENMAILRLPAAEVRLPNNSYCEVDRRLMSSGII